MFIPIFLRIAVIFVIISVGALARWRRVLDSETTEGLSRVAIELTLPFLYFYTLAANLTPQIFKDISIYPLYAAGLTLFFFALSWLASLLVKLPLAKQRTFMFLITFPNYGFLAIPLIFNFFGEEGLLKIVMFNLGITFLYWTLGVGMLSGARIKGRGIVKNLVNNSMLALILGLVVGIGPWGIPLFILESAKLIGSASIPLALIVVGSLLAQGGLKRPAAWKPLLVIVLWRLLIIPALSLILLKNCLNLSPLVSVIIMLQAALPSASTTPILVKRFGGDAELSAQGVFFTTLLSIITVPIFLSLLLK